jgi:hypothetical protein
MIVLQWIMTNWTLGQLGKNKAKQTQTKPIQSQYKPKQTQNKPNFTSKKMCSAGPKRLTITNMDANFKKCTVFHLFIERTLFGR